MKPKKFLLVLGIVVLPLSSRAQLTLDECHELAAQNYPLLKQHQLIRQTEAYTVDNVKRGYYPALSLTAQASVQSDVMALPDEMQKMFAQSGREMEGLRKDQYRIALDVNQVLWDGGAMAARKQDARVWADVQHAQTDVALYDVRERVNNLFFGILLLEDKLRLNEDLQTLLQSNCEKLQNMRKSGIAMQSDVDAVRAEWLKAKQQHTELLSTKQSFGQVLAIFIGKKPEEVVDLQKPSAEVPVTMENRRPELRSFEAQLKQTDAQDQLLGSSIRPRFSLFAQGFYGYPGYDTFSDMLDHKFTLNGIIGVRMSWNISSFYTLKNDRRKLTTSRHAIETARETFLFNNRLQQTQQSAAIVRFRKLMEEDDEIIALRASVRRSAEVKLEHGVIDVNKLLQEITRENEAKTGKSVHEIELLKHIHELKHTLNQ